MTKIEQLASDCERFYSCKSITDSLELIDIYADFLFLTIRNRKADVAETKELFDARMIFQMMLTKTLHLKSIVNGISHKSKDGTVLNNIIDPTILICLIRNLYETVGMFNVIYCNPKSDDERTILYCLWVHSGLLYRNRFETIATTLENIKKLEDDKAYMSQLVKEIENTVLFKNLSEKNQKKIRTRLESKEYLITINNNEIRCLKWHELPDVMGIRSGLMTEIYTYFSLNTHPSYVSVFQFASMFKKESESYSKLANFNLKYFFTLTSIFIADYIKLFPEALKTFESLNIKDQIVIDYYNIFMRGKEFSINNSWKTIESVD